MLLLESALLCAIALFVQALAPAYALLVLAQFVLGLGVGGTIAVLSAYIGRMAPEGRAGTAFGLDAMAVALAGAVGPSVGGWLSDTISRRAPLWAGGIAMMLAGLAVLRLPKDSSQRATSVEGT